MKTIKLAILISLLAFTSKAQEIFFNPSGADGQIIEYDQFTLSYNEQHEQPNWVAYVLEESEIYLQSRKRPYRFEEDPNVKTESAVHDDYTNTGFDRGHLSRAMYNKISEEAYLESFFMSNVSPQHGVNFNRTGGDWYNLEELEISFSKSLNKLYCVTGPIFKDNLGTIGKTTTVTVPGYFYKVFLSPDQSKAIAFVVRHDQEDIETLWDAAVTVDSLEEITGIDFWPFLQDQKENNLEKELDLQYWKKHSN